MEPLIEKTRKSHTILFVVAITKNLYSDEKVPSHSTKESVIFILIRKRKVKLYGNLQSVLFKTTYR